MKKNKWLIMFATMVMFAVGCQIGDNDIRVNNNEGGSSNGSNNGGNGSNNGSGTDGIDYTSYIGSDRSILVNNNTSRNLVAFAGKPSDGNLISGIPASKSNHGLKKTSYFSDSTDFVMFLVTADDYKANINNLRELDNKPFTRIYAYYNKSSTNNNYVAEISEKLGGEYSIVLNNTTDKNVELRYNGWFGETIGYAGRGTVKTTFHVDEGDYYIWPAFRIYKSDIDEIVTVFPKYTTGGENQKGQYIRKRFSLDSSNPSAELNAAEWVSGVKYMHSSAYICIINSSTSAISFYNAANGSPMRTSTGKELINVNAHMVFEVHMIPKGDSEYSEYITSSQYSVGAADIGKTYITSGSSLSNVNFDYYAGKMYTIVVNGTDMELEVNTSWMDTSEDVNF